MSLKALDALLTIWPGNIYFLLVIRRQPVWLASAYAQRSRKIPGANQLSFKKWASSPERPLDSPLRWPEIIGNLIDLVGEKSLVIPLEVLSTLPDRLPEALSRDSWVYRVREAVSKKLNSKALDENNWKLPPLGHPNENMMGYVKAALREHYASRFPSYIVSQLPWIERMPGQQAIINYFEKQRSESISLTNSMHRDIARVYRGTNKATSRIINLDLGELGYYL